MRLLLSVVALVLLSLLGSRYGFRESPGSLGLRLLFGTGTHFVLLGFVLGPLGLGLLRPELLAPLSPFLALGLGWIGLLFGMQFDRRILRGFPPLQQAAAAGQALLAYGLLVAAFLAARRWLPTGDPVLLPLLLAAAATACVSSPTGVGIVFGSVRTSGPLSRALSLTTSLDGAVGIAAVAGVFAFFHPPAMAAGVSWNPLPWLALPLVLGLFFGWLFLSLTRDRPGPREMGLFLVGLGLTAAGSHLFLYTSVLLGSAVAGALVVNLSPLRRRVSDALTRWEKPIHVLFLLLGGALLRPTGWELVPLVAGYVVLRLAAKAVGGALLHRWWAPGSSSPLAGLGLGAQGGISIAMAVSVYLVYGSGASTRPSVETFLATVVLGVVASELLGAPLIRWILTREGEARGIA